MNPVIYTAICGKELQDRVDPRTDIHYFTGEGLFSNPVMEAKRYKMLGHRFFPDNDVLIWVDGNIRLNIPVEEAIAKYLGDNDLAIFKHPYRSCLYQEINTLKTDGRFSENAWLQKQLEEQESCYRTWGFPEDWGLWECNFIIRRNNVWVEALFDAWWCELCRWQFRDQVAFPFVLSEYEDALKFKTIIAENIRTNPDFQYQWTPSFPVLPFNCAHPGTG